MIRVTTILGRRDAGGQRVTHSLLVRRRKSLVEIRRLTDSSA